MSCLACLPSCLDTLYNASASASASATAVTNVPAYSHGRMKRGSKYGGENGQWTSGNTHWVARLGKNEPGCECDNDERYNDEWEVEGWDTCVL